MEVSSEMYGVIPPIKFLNGLKQKTCCVAFQHVKCFSVYLLFFSTDIYPIFILICLMNEPIDTCGEVDMVIVWSFICSFYTLCITHVPFICPSVVFIHLDSQMRLHYRICAVSRQISAVCRIYICVGWPVKVAQIGHTIARREWIIWIFACGPWWSLERWLSIILNWTSRAFFSNNKPFWEFVDSSQDWLSSMKWPKYDKKFFSWIILN